jgi:hypothetical protein
MRVLLRFLGIGLLAQLARRLPGPLAWWATAVVLLAANLLPVVAVLHGSAGMGDVFLVYWIENVVVYLTGIVRVATADGNDGARMTARGDRISSASFFALHYGTFTLVHGIFTVIIVIITGLTGGWVPVLVLSAAITASHLFNLGFVWFGRGEQHVVSPATAMFAPYPRMIAMHISIILGFSIALDGDASNQSTGVAILCGLKTLIDLGFHLRGRRRVLTASDDGLYGAPAA